MRFVWLQPIRARHILALAALSVLAGCDTLHNIIVTPAASIANGHMADAVAQCDAQFPAMRGMYLPHAKCINAAEDAYYRPLMAYPNLLELAETNRETLALRVDRGEIDPADMNRMVPPEDAPLTPTNTTLTGPTLRMPQGATPVHRPRSVSCASTYGFSDCE